MDRDIFFMQKALKLAEKAKQAGEIPVGCVIVKDNKVISASHNYVEKGQNALYHAELLALHKASQKLGWRLEGASVYVTLEPCAMCTGALIAARIERLCFALKDHKRGCCGSLHNFPEDPRFNHHFEVQEGILAEESLQLLQSFFVQLRQRNKKRKALKRERQNSRLKEEGLSCSDI